MNKPAAGNAGIASRLTIGHHWPGVGERWALENAMRHSITLLSLLLGCGGCTYPNQFGNVRKDAPHAVLVGEHVTASHINQKPTSFWRGHERYRIPPGPTTVQTFTGFWDFRHYPLVQFTAISGHRYTLTHEQSNDCHRVLAWERGADAGDARVVARVEEIRKCK